MKRFLYLTLLFSFQLKPLDPLEKVIQTHDMQQLEIKSKRIEQRTVTAFICSPKISLSIFVLMLGMGLPTFVKVLRQDYRTFAQQEALYDSIGYSSVVIAGILLYMGITEERDARNTNSHGGLATF